MKQPKHDKRPSSLSLLVKPVEGYFFSEVLEMWAILYFCFMVFTGRMLVQTEANFPHSKTAGCFPLQLVEEIFLPQNISREM